LNSNYKEITKQKNRKRTKKRAVAQLGHAQATSPAAARAPFPLSLSLLIFFLSFPADSLDPPVKSTFNLPSP
jgi:hypothetical protein